MGEEIRAFSANVVGKSVKVGIWGGFEARSLSGFAAVVEKGFGLDTAVVADVENGFALLFEEVVVPKMLSPSMGAGDFGVRLLLGVAFAGIEGEILDPRKALMLPGFFLHVLERQAKI